MLRKTHRKSRYGCTHCKQRRVKCDEKKPSCKSCTARGFNCIYASPNIVWMGAKQTRTSEAGHREPSHESPSSSTQVNSIEETSSDVSSMTPNLNLEGLELVLHWFTATAATVAGNPATLHTVQTVILTQAMKHRFLLHGILALAALHLAQFHSGKDATAESKYSNIATAHHNEGLMTYKSILEDINEDNYPASIAFSAITMIYAFAQSRPKKGSEEKRESLDDLVQISMLGKGWQKVVSVSRDLDCHADKEFMKEPPKPIYIFSAETEAVFAHLQELNILKSQNEEEKAANATAITSLKAVFGKLASPSGAFDAHATLEWTTKLQNDFVCLLRERRPLALVVTAYFCVALDRMPEVWWVSGWSHGLLRAILRDLKPEYQRELDWVRQQMQLDDDS